MGRKGSVLILALWIITLFTVLAVSLGVKSRLDTQIMSSELEIQDENQFFESAVQISRFLIESDRNTSFDSPLDSWYGEHPLSNWLKAEGVFFTVEDEESKLNINAVSPVILRTFFEILIQEGKLPETDPAELAASITRWRGDTPIFGTPSTFHQKSQPFESLEELLLTEKMTWTVFQSIKPYLTAYGNLGQKTLRININTASPEVLQAVILNLDGDAFAKKEFYSALLRFREGEETNTPHKTFMRARDLEAYRFTLLLRLPNTVLMTAVVNQFLTVATTDSGFFMVKVEKRNEKQEKLSYAEGVIGASGGRTVPFMPTQATVLGNAYFRTDNLELLSWQEGV